MVWSFLTALVELGLALAALSLGDRADAYPVPMDFDGTLLKWNLGIDGVVTYEVLGSADDVTFHRDAVDSSAVLWSAVDGSKLRLEPVAEGAFAQMTFTFKREIVGGSYSSGFAVFDAQTKEGPEHCSSEILVNDTTSGLYLAKTVLHEMGHCVGLGHSVFPLAIMSYKLSENEFELDTDDEAAVARLYPVQDVGGLPKGCAIQTSPSSNALVQVLLLLLPLGAIGGGRRRTQG